MKYWQWLAVLFVVLIMGCATLPPPSGPSAFAQSTVKITKHNRDRVAYCMQAAAEAAQQVQQSNMGKQVAGVAIGSLAGAVVGRAVSTPGRTYVGPGHFRGYYHGRPVYGRNVYHESGTDLTGVGLVGGGATGYAIASGTQQSPQQMYDAAYIQCMRQ